MPGAIRKVKITETVTNELLTLIRNGTFATGQRLPPERELSLKFGISRASLRDAFRQLELLGHLEIRQGDGTYVRAPTSDTISTPFRGLLSGSPQAALDLLEFRLILEPEVAALAAKRATPEHATSFERLLEQQRRVAAQGLRISKEDLEFHHLIAQIAGNTVILQVLTTLRSLLGELRVTALAGRLPDLTIVQHERIALAILGNNPTEARATMLDHLNAVAATNDLKPISHAQS